jgi:hypothetical protein
MAEALAESADYLPGPIAVRLLIFDLQLRRRPYYFAGGLNGLSVHLRTAGSCSGASSQSVHR